jgi:short-subunit dehydrogenase
MATRQTALITGASTGIGRDLAIVFAENGFDLVINARRPEPLEQLAADLRGKHGINVRVLPKDLSSPSAPPEIFDELSRDNVVVDVLVNNAGFGGHGWFARMDEVEVLAMLQVNVVALTRLTRLFLPGMIERRRGRVMNVSSTAAFQPGPLMAVYYASKAYVQSLSEALASETRGTGVTVTALCPGPTTTEFATRAGVGDARLFKRSPMDSMTVARIGFAGLMRGDAVVIPGLKNRFLVHAGRLSPRAMVISIARRINETPQTLRDAATDAERRAVMRGQASS